MERSTFVMLMKEGLYRWIFLALPRPRVSQGCLGAKLGGKIGFVGDKLTKEVKIPGAAKEGCRDQCRGHGNATWFFDFCVSLSPFYTFALQIWSLCFLRFFFFFFFF